MNRCPGCGCDVPDNEWAAFQRCESCYVDPMHMVNGSCQYQGMHRETLTPGKYYYEGGTRHLLDS